MTAITPSYRETTPTCGGQGCGSVRPAPDFDACAISARCAVRSEVKAPSHSIPSAGTVVSGAAAAGGSGTWHGRSARMSEHDEFHTDADATVGDAALDEKRGRGKPFTSRVTRKLA